jgi:hypothetical protein
MTGKRRKKPAPKEDDDHEARKRELDEATARIHELQQKIAYASSPLRAQMDQAQGHLDAFMTFANELRDEVQSLSLSTKSDSAILRQMLENCLRATAVLMYRVAADYEDDEWPRIEKTLAAIVELAQDERAWIAKAIEESSRPAKKGKKKR